MRNPSVSPDYKWSLRGNYVAFPASLAERAPLDPRRGVPHGLIEPGRPRALFVLDVRSGGVMQLTPEAINVSSSPGDFAFSPDEGSLVVAIDSEENDSIGLNTDLVKIDRASRNARPLVTRVGMDGHPCWSPDGRWIAFATHREDPSYSSGWPALVRATGGRVIDFPQDVTPMGFGSCRWSADSNAVHYTTSLEMTSRLVRVESASLRASVLPQVSALRLVFEGNRSFSADGTRMAFTSESYTTPADLFVAALSTKGQPNGAPVRLTHLAPNFALSKLVYSEELSWPSSDGKFTIHALLLTPASARTGDRVRRKLPTLLYFVGGPTMVSRNFGGTGADGWNGMALPLAARGYAVLIPNTRGRGGYGVEFGQAIRIGKNRARDPLADALAGVDLLIANGIADSERTGVLGHSYGGYLTAYTITQTNRFKAAVIHDASPFFLTNGTFFGGLIPGVIRLSLRDCSASTIPTMHSSVRG